jgi:hypothetical protein
LIVSKTDALGEVEGVSLMSGRASEIEAGLWSDNSTVRAAIGEVLSGIFDVLNGEKAGRKTTLDGYKLE